jgi:hypothetical protein
MLEKLLATLAMCGFIVYLFVLIDFVRKPDLILVIVIPVGIAIYGMWTAFRDKSKGGNGEPSGS